VSKKTTQSIQQKKVAQNAKEHKVNKRANRANKNIDISKNNARKGLLSSIFGVGNAPKTVQDTIPYKHIYKDGICVLPDNKYNKTIAFKDINYQLAKTEDKQQIFDKYCKFLNYFSTEMEIQLSFVNRFTNREDIESSIDIPFQKDEFNHLRKEYREMLRNQLAKGNNGLIKNKYITFSIQAKSLKEARTRLESIERDILLNFKTMAVRAWSLDGVERVQLLHSQLHPTGKEKVDFNWSDLGKTGMSTKDVICPSSFDFKENRFFKMGDIWGSVSYLKIVATELPDDLLNQFLNLESAMTLSIHIRKIEQDKALKLVKRKLTDVDAMKIKAQQKAINSGHDMDIISQDIITYGEEARGLLRSLQSRNEGLFMITLLVLNMAGTKAKLKNEIVAAKGIAQKESCTLRPLDFQQEKGLISSLAIGKNEIEIERALTTSSTAIFVPFTTSELFEEGRTMYYGLNALSNNLIMASRSRSLPNPNGLILGIPGTGKSFSAKREMFNVFLTTKDDILVIDPEGEYAPVINALHGQVIDVSQNSKNFINPLDIHENYAADTDGGDPVAMKSDFILSFCELVLQKRDGLQPEESSIIDRCVKKMYRQYFEDPTPAKMPILEDLYALLLEENQNGNDAAGYVASALELYVTGSMNMFNRRTNINLNNRVVCFDIRSLQNNLKKIGMLVLQDAVWGRVSQNREIKKHTWLYVDEFHLLLKEDQTANYAVEIYKRFRKWRGVVTGITQNVSDLLTSAQSENIFKNSPFIIMLGQAETDRRILAKSLVISDEQLSFVTQTGPGEGLLFFGNTVLPFIDRFPKTTEMYKLMTTDPNDS